MSKVKMVFLGGVALSLIILVVGVIAFDDARSIVHEVVVEPIQCIMSRGIEFCTTNQHPEAGMSVNFSI